MNGFISNKKQRKSYENLDNLISINCLNMNDSNNVEINNNFNALTSEKLITDNASTDNASIINNNFNASISTEKLQEPINQPLKTIVSEDYISESSDDNGYFSNEKNIIKYFDLSDDEDEYYENNFDNILDMEVCEELNKPPIIKNPHLADIKNLVSNLQFNKALELFDNITLKEEYFNHIFVFFFFSPYQ